MSQKHPISPIKNPPDSKRPNSSLGNKIVTRGATAINPVSILRTFDKNDPVKYDFALFGIGVFEKF